MGVAIAIAQLLHVERPLAARPARERTGARSPREAAVAAYTGLMEAALRRDLGALRAYGARIAEGGLELDAAGLPAWSAFD